MGGPSRTGSSSSRTRSTFGDGSWRLRFSSTCTPGSRCSTMTSSVAVTSTKKASWRSATRSQDGLYAPGSMAPPKASTAAAAVAWPAESEGKLTSGALGCVGAVAQRPVGEPGDHTGLVGRQPRATTDLVAAAANRRSAAVGVEAGHRDRRSVATLVAVGGNDQRQPRDDPADHDQQAHRDAAYEPRASGSCAESS